MHKGDRLAGIAAESVQERIAAKSVLSEVTLADIRNYPLLSPDEDDVSRIIDGLINRSIYQSVKNWTVAEPCFATRSRFNGYKNA